MPAPKISLEQWRALVAVVEAGGYAAAAEVLHKTQSTVTYAVQKLEALLGVEVFELQGRKAQLTPAGQVLYRHARALLDEAARVERAAASLAQGWEPELRLAVEVVFPTWLLLQCLDRFAKERPDTRIELYETVLGGTDEAVLEARVDLAIASRLPPGFLLDPLMTIKFVCAAAPHHPLHRLGRPLTLADLRQHRQLVIRDSGTQRKREGAWLGAEQRWTVSAKATSIRAATMGLGFAWYAENIIREELDSGALKPLPLVEGGEREVALYLIVTHGDAAGPGAQRLARIIRDGVANRCPLPDAAG
ncbi:LysR family transcriptional regulator [Sinimarinibacterium thermocellulolyticum]|uniref:LysR family transcriptional regulator n=1 Tax=Sinimarinibacterium thermocellulolyticum TaxID=3170016 RepID=A0ABV2A6F7_9GAMM